MPRSSKSWNEIQDSLSACAGRDDMVENSEVAQVEEMMVLGCLACPREKTLRQKDIYFSKTEFMDLETLLKCAQNPGFV